MYVRKTGIRLVVEPAEDEEARVHDAQCGERRRRSRLKAIWYDMLPRRCGTRHRTRRQASGPSAARGVVRRGRTCALVFPQHLAEAQLVEEHHLVEGVALRRQGCVGVRRRRRGRKAGGRFLERKGGEPQTQHVGEVVDLVPSQPLPSEEEDGGAEGRTGVEGARRGQRSLLAHAFPPQRAFPRAEAPQRVQLVRRGEGHAVQRAAHAAAESPERPRRWSERMAEAAVRRGALCGRVRPLQLYAAGGGIAVGEREGSGEQVRRVGLPVDERLARRGVVGMGGLVCGCAVCGVWAFAVLCMALGGATMCKFSELWCVSRVACCMWRGAMCGVAWCGCVGVWVGG